MKKNNDIHSEERFLQNRQKRKNPSKKKAVRNSAVTTKKVATVKKSTKARSSKSSAKDNRTTTLIVASVLCSIAIIFSLLLIFVPGFKSLALKHILSSVTSSSGLKNVNISENSMSDGITETIVSSEGETGKLHKDVYTFLATGTDHSGNLTDVIMIAKFDTSDSRVDILQIPRDTFIRLCGSLIIDDSGKISPANFSSSGYETKINSAFSTGKNFAKKPLNNLLSAAKGKSVSEIEALCDSKEYGYLDVTQQQVSKYLAEKDETRRKELIENMQRNFGIKYLSTLIYYSYGIPIDYHAQVNTKGFRGIVDAIGGVDLYVPQNMYHNDPTQNLYINLKKGQQHLDGAKAEQFVRFRGYTMGDIDRIDAQKSFISAFLNKLFSPSTITKISQITYEIQRNLYTNLTLQETADFAVKVLDMDLANSFTMTTLPGRPVDVTYGDSWISYYSADKDAVMKLVNESFNKYDINLPAEMFGLHTLSSSPAIIGTTVVGTDNPDITPESVVSSPEELENVEVTDGEITDITISESEETQASQDNTEPTIEGNTPTDTTVTVPTEQEGTDSDVNVPVVTPDVIRQDDTNQDTQLPEDVTGDLSDNEDEYYSDSDISPIPDDSVTVTVPDGTQQETAEITGQTAQITTPSEMTAEDIYEIFSIFKKTSETENN